MKLIHCSNAPPAVNAYSAINYLLLFEKHMDSEINCNFVIRWIMPYVLINSKRDAI